MQDDVISRSLQKQRASPICDSDNSAQIVDHLLFHKALSGDSDDPERINRYIELAKSHTFDVTSIKDPFDRSIIILLELATDQHVNPWDVDLVKFSVLYLKRANEHKIDLVVAGRIILMAWTVLRIQSEELIASASVPQAEEPEAAPDWTEIGSWDDAATEYTARVVGGTVPIDEKVRRKGDRKVTLMELIKAFEEAKNEVILREQFDASRIKQIALTRDHYRENISNRLDKEDVEEGIGVVWERISQFNGQPIPLADLCDTTNREDLVRTLVSVLFLASDKYGRRINVWQQNFPYGKIFVQNLEKQMANAN